MHIARNVSNRQASEKEIIWGSEKLHFCRMGNKSSTATPVNPELLNSVIHDQGSERISSCLYSRRGGKNVNQDSAVMYQGYGEKDGTLCGVFDGHGKYGHFVSRIVKERLPLILLDRKKAVMETQATSDGASSSNGNSYDWETACVSAFEEMDEEIKLVKRFDASFSGSTAVVVIKQGDELFIANLGDSRAILGRKQENELVALQLTVDLKPGTPAELHRIRSSNGRVFALRAEPDLQRAWLPTVYSPGMAMSRAFGDLVMKNYGIISIPVVTYHQITSDDLFIVLATDGIWDVLSNEEVISIVSKTQPEEMAAKAVVDAAVTAWRVKYPRDRPDDCTAICFFLHSKDLEHTPTSSSPSEDQEPHD